MHIVPRYEHVSDIAMCAHDNIITLGAACCDQDCHVAVQYAVTYRKTCCVREVRTCCKSPEATSRPVSGCYVKCWPETAKTRPTVVYALRGTERTLYPSVLYFQNVIRCQAALRAHRISPTSIKEQGIH
jgi:hypothetical protein